MVVGLKGRPVRRSDFITLIGGAVTWPVTDRGQQTIPVVGFVFSGGQSSRAAPYVTAFKLGLEEVGFAEGQNLVAEYHWLGGHDEGSLNCREAKKPQRC
jgi:putative tryptophan/tyrosine transport system substrate-binding protein